MTGPRSSDRSEERLHPPPPKGFDPFTATREQLKSHGLPLRPDPHSQPGLAALWDRQADRYRHFDHLEPPSGTAFTTQAAASPGAPGAAAVTAGALGPAPIESCGFSLVSLAAPFTALFVTWTVPNLRFSPSPLGVNRFRTFVGLGFLDVHVEMSVDSGEHVTSRITAQGVGDVDLPVAPGDVVSGALCLDTKPPGRANYVLANETRSQTMNFSFDTGFPPAVTIDAGVTRGGLDQPVHPLAGFGVVYFDEISAFSTDGSRSLTSGEAITMVDHDGSTLARPVRLNDFAFKTVFVAA